MQIRELVTVLVTGSHKPDLRSAHDDQRNNNAVARRMRWTVTPPKPGRSEMIEQPTSISWSDEDSDEDEMFDFVVAASEMLEELLARPQPNYLRLAGVN
jgi:hypothetical protein